MNQEPTVPAPAPWSVSRWILARLTRVTTSGRLVPEIDGLRFVAIMAVIVHHSQAHFFPTDGMSGGPAWNATADLVALGWFGVELFFVISGFILAVPFAERYLLGRPAVPLGKYFLRRLTRLEPPYVISLLAYLLWFGDPARIRELLPHFFASMFYVHAFVYGKPSLLNHITWSLEVEVQFYILAPLLCTVFAVKRTWLRRGILLLAIAASALQQQFFASEFLNLTFVGSARYFLAGLLLADVYLVDWKAAPVRTAGWDIVAVVAWGLVPFLIATPFRVFGIQWDMLLLPLTVLTAYIGAFRGRMFGRFFSNPWIVAVGGMCYTLYLYHNQFIWRVEQYLGVIHKGRPLVTLLQLLADLLGVVAIGAVLFVAFEKPFMQKDWPQRAWRFVTRRRPAAAPAPVAPLGNGVSSK